MLSTKQKYRRSLRVNLLFQSNTNTNLSSEQTSPLKRNKRNVCFHSTNFVMLIMQRSEIPNKNNCYYSKAELAQMLKREKRDFRLNELLLKMHRDREIREKTKENFNEES